MFKAIIVDDQWPCRETVSLTLKKHCPQVEVVASVDCLKKAVNDILLYEPDIVFLDIELPDGKGFDIFQHGFAPKLKVIFTTAHSAYAPLMYHYYPVTFLLKPIDELKLIEAVNKAIEQIRKDETSSSAIQNRICIKETGKMLFVDTQKIIYCQASENYTHIHQLDGSIICSTTTLKEFESKLTYPQFIRVHQSYLVNVNYIICIEKTNNLLVLADGQKIEISQRKRAQLFELAKSLSV